MSKFIKGFIVGFIVGAIFMSSSNDNLNATNNPLDTSRGAVEWNPIFVKIVE